MNRTWLCAAIVAILVLPAHVPAERVGSDVSGRPPRAVVHDVVIVGGRVMDPASGLDAVRSIGIIIDRATYREPTLPPLGVSHVLVNGVVVVRHGSLQAGVLPGRAVRAATR